MDVMVFDKYNQLVAVQEVAFLVVVLKAVMV